MMTWRFVALVVFIAIGVMWLSERAFSHGAESGWTYPLACCSNRDCDHLHRESVKETSAGYAVVLRYGDHHLIAEGDRVEFLIPYGDRRIKHSPDGIFHLCMSPTSKRLICFFAPPGYS